MCWSPEVTLFFVILEVTSCALLLMRGERWFLLGMGPLVLQEIIQYFLWQEILKDERVGTKGCTTRNTQLTMAQTVVVGGLVPLGFAVISVRSVEKWRDAVSKIARQRPRDLDASREGVREERLHTFLRIENKSLFSARAASYGAVAYIFVVATYIGSVEPNRWRGGNFCTTRGSNAGHQSWPFVTPPPPTFLITILTPLDRLAEWSINYVRPALSWIPVWVPGGAVDIIPAHGEDWTGMWACVVFWFSIWIMYFAIIAMITVYQGECKSDSGHRRGRLSQFTIVFLGMTSLSLAVVFYGLNEGGSVWCWASSIGVVLMVLDPLIAKYAEKYSVLALQKSPLQRTFTDMIAIGLWRELRGPTEFVDGMYNLDVAMKETLGIEYK